METASDSINGTESDFQNDTKPGDPTQIITIDKAILHPKFSREEDGPHNLALLRLTIPARFTDFVTPACLETSEKLGDGPLIVTDWMRGMFDDQR